MSRTTSGIAYGLLGLPLAMSALPIYIQAPSYYTTQLGLSLASVGWVLFLARFVDALQDPLLGRIIDRLQGRIAGWFGAAGVLLALAFAGLWLPQVRQEYLLLWLAVMLVLVYMAHSMLNIAYLSWGARLPHAMGSVSVLDAAAWREAAGLLGVIFASIVPGLILVRDPAHMAIHMGWYSLLFAFILGLALLALLLLVPCRTSVPQQHWRADWQVLRTNREFLSLLGPYFLNAVSVSVPATLVLFFIRDYLHAEGYTAAFLAAYFIAAAIGLPCWVHLARRIGVLASWRCGMVLSLLAFAGTGWLQSGSVAGFLLICLTSGLALGADLALPPVLLAQVIEPEAPAAAYYGVWTLLAKLALAVSGLALPLLAYVDYHPGLPANSALCWAYAGLPCLFKSMALLLLWRLPVASRGV